MNKSTKEVDRNYPDPVITDLNMSVALLKMQGLTNTAIAKQLNIGLPDVNYHLKRVSTLTQLKTNGEISDPINSHRARLQRLLGRTEGLYKHILKPKTYKQSAQHLGIAKDTAIAMDRGLGVFVDKSETSTTTDINVKTELAIRENKLIDQFGLMRPYVEIPGDIEIVDELDPPPPAGDSHEDAK